VALARLDDFTTVDHQVRSGSYIILARKVLREARRSISDSLDCICSELEKVQLPTDLVVASIRHDCQSGNRLFVKSALSSFCCIVITSAFEALALHSVVFIDG
jgi:hypothetical protein